MNIIVYDNFALTNDADNNNHKKGGDYKQGRSSTDNFIWMVKKRKPQNGKYEQKDR